jgi:hypothetical protein
MIEISSKQLMNPKTLHVLMIKHRKAEKPLKFIPKTYNLP